MMDDLSTFQEEQIQNRIMESLENERALTYFPRGRSMLMMKCVAQQILGNWLEIFSTYLTIYSVDYGVIMEAELTELNHSCIIPFKGSQKSNSGTVFWKYFVVLCESVENNFMVRKLDMGRDLIAAEKNTANNQQT